MQLSALLWLLLLQHTLACRDLACFADYIQTLTCLWGNSSGTAGNGTWLSLTAKWNCGDRGNCSLLPRSGDAAQRHYTCFWEQMMCTSVNDFEVEITAVPAGEETLPPWRCRKKFMFYENIKPHPPVNLTAKASPQGYNISWEIRYDQDGTYSYLDGKLEYELRYRRRGQPWQGQSQKHLLQDTRTLQLLPQELEEGAEYELQVRAHPADGSSYRGTWSDWSAQAVLRSLPKTASDSGGGGGARWVLVPTLLLSLVIVLMTFLGCCHKRLWKWKVNLCIPSPAPFFQPLYLAYHGDFKKWVVGTPCPGATLDVFEWGTVLPEVFDVVHKCLPPSPAKGEQRAGLAALLETAHLPPCQQAPSASHEASLEQSYGRLSIDTVTVAGELAACCPPCDWATPRDALEQLLEAEEAETDAYRGVDLDGSGGRSPSGVPHSPSFPASSESRARDVAPALLQAEGPLGRISGDGVTFSGLSLEPWAWAGPLCLSSPCEEELFCRSLCPPDLEADSDPATGLDLDTIDSGFVDSDCGSPVDCEFERSPPGCGSEPSTGEEGGEVREAFLRSYVKQWVSSHNRTQPS